MYEDYITVGVKVEKKYMLRFLSHMEYMRIIEKTMRRANFPLWFSKGFHPRPKISFPVAIPTGVVDLAGYFELRLNETSFQLDTNELIERFNHFAPNGLEMKKLKLIEKGELLHSIKYYSFRMIIEKCELNGFQSMSLKKEDEKIVEFHMKELKKFFVIEYLTEKDKMMRPDKMLDFNFKNNMILLICTEAFDEELKPIVNILEG